MKSINKYESYANAIRSLGQVVIGVGQLDIPSISISEDQIVEQPDGETSVGIPEDSAYWDTWTTITETVEKYIGEYDESQDILSDHGSDTGFVSGPKDEYVAQTLFAELHAGGDEVALLSMEYTNIGDFAVTAEYRRPFAGDGWIELYGGILPWGDVDPVAIAREIASGELAYLVYETGSNAAALDYWQTHEQDGWYRQHEWADIRGVGRQTVNDRIRHARRSLENE